MERAVNEPTTVAGAPARSAVDKALDVLNALVRPDGPHRLADLARETGLAKATVHRMLRTLADSGFAVPVEGGRYDVGPRLLGMSAAALAASRESRFVRPVLLDLQKRTGHTAHYAVPHGHRAIHLDKVEPAQGYRMNTHVGAEVPLHSTAVGRAILARLPEEEVTAVLESTPLAARTPCTLTDPDRIRRELATADRLGYAVDDEQDEQSIRSVAAPVVDGMGRAVGAVGVSGLVFTLNLDTVDVLGPLVRDAAAHVSATLRRPDAMRVLPGGVR